MPHSANNSISTQTRMSRPSSTSTYSKDAFPKQAGAQLLAPEALDNGPKSPSPSQFSFASDQRPHFESIADLRPATSATSRNRAQYYEDSFSYKDGIVSSARDRVIKDAPIVAELRTNVIVCFNFPIGSTLLLPVLTKRRSRMSTPWSPTFPTISQRDTRGQKRLL